MTGARPNFIKLAPLIYAITDARQQGHDITYTLVYAGTRDDATIESSLFDDLSIAPPTVFLNVDTADTIAITTTVMERMEMLLSCETYDVVLVVDDLASTMATAIVTKKHGIPLAHLAAGTRSFDINMPKEVNRLVIDGLSDFLFTAGSAIGTTANQKKIYNVGNILLDTLRRRIATFQRPAVLDTISDRYAVLTINRKKLLNDRGTLSSLLGAIVHAAQNNGLPVIAPLSTFAKQKVDSLKMPVITTIPTLPYPQFGYLAQHATVIITDSGNIAEEATFNNVPCITMNNYTEHIETVQQGTNILVNEDPALLYTTLTAILHGNTKAATLPDHWDGHAAERILHTLINNIHP